jgi:hypothetical protein
MSWARARLFFNNIESLRLIKDLLIKCRILTSRSQAHQRPGAPTRYARQGTAAASWGSMSVLMNLGRIANTQAPGARYAYTSVYRCLRNRRDLAL